MPLQNRVDPFGVIHAVPERGKLMGNRGGKFHRDDQALGKRRWASHHWICCDLDFKARHHEPIGAGYTSLFFLDEVTALAAGHRPCFECRRGEAKAFLADERADAFDRRVHEERMRGPQDISAPLPDGAMVCVGDAAFAIRRGQMLRWSFAGYDGAFPVEPTAKLLTPPSITAILARGYQPRWHSSAQQWDERT
jgi:hypothetical protein